MTTSKRRPKQPITAHRLFPVIVALWLAALLGLGSLVVPSTTIEGLVVRLSLPAIVPASTPPLGFTARMLIALACTGLGAIAGFALGRRLKPREAQPVVRQRAPRAPARTATPTVRSRDAHPDAPPRRPLNLSEDLVIDAGEALAEDAAPAPAPRRRALSLNDESLPATYIDHAPLPGTDPWAEDVRREEAEDPFAITVDPRAWDDMIGTPAPAEPAIAHDREPAFDIGPFAGPKASAGSLGSEPEAPSAPFLADVAPEPAPAPDPVAAPAPAPIAEPAAISPVRRRSPVASAPLEELGLVQLIERLGVAIAERRMAEPATVDPSSASPGPAQRPLFVPVDAPRASEVVEVEPVVITEPALDVDAAAVPEPEVSVQRPETATQPQRIVSLRPAALAEPDAGLEDDSQHESALPPRFLSAASFQRPSDAASSVPFGADGEQDDADEAESEPRASVILPDGSREDRYSSLTDMASPLPRTEFVRIDMPEDSAPGTEPVVIFPGQGLRSPAPFHRPSTVAAASGEPPVRAPSAPSLHPAAPSTLPDPAEADRALRAALATLQRMTAKG